MGMKVWIDQDLCTGDGLCEEIAPDVFTLLDDGLACVETRQDLHAIGRARGTVVFPARFMLVGAMNPCPCGYFGDLKRECRCGPTQVQRYRQRVSGPLLDRIDLHIEVPAVEYRDVASERAEESSAAVRERIARARQRQHGVAWQHPGAVHPGDMVALSVQQRDARGEDREDPERNWTRDGGFTKELLALRVDRLLSE